MLSPEGWCGYRLFSFLELEGGRRAAAEAGSRKIEYRLFRGSCMAIADAKGSRSLSSSRCEQ